MRYKTMKWPGLKTLLFLLLLLMSSQLLAQTGSERGAGLEELSDDYLYELAKQLGFMAAIMCGFCAAFLGTLLPHNSDKKSYYWVLRMLIFASCCFLITIMAGQGIILGAHPDAPAAAKENGLSDGSRLIFVISMIFGIYGLCGALGLSGFIKSRRLGIYSLTVSLITGLMLTWLMVG